MIMEKYTELPLEIDAERLMQFPAGRYLAVDMRDEYSCGYGMLGSRCRLWHRIWHRLWHMLWKKASP